MAGYVRQSSADIVPTAVVRATPLNNEYNALRDAFVHATGHKHDGTAAEGAYVPLISDTNNRNKVVTDSTNNRIGVFVSVSSSAVEQMRFQDGAFVPVTDNDIDLGTSSLEFKDLYIDGTANIDSLIADTADINGGTIDAAVIGGSTAAAGTFTTLVANTSVTTPALTVNTSAVIASADINAGTIDGAVIGGSSAQAITGTTVTATTGFVGPITGAVTGNVTGNLTGNVTGNVTGDLTGNVTASSGSSSFNDVTINGTLNMNASSAGTITNLTNPTNAQDAATKSYVDTSISNLIDTAPGTLDTLNELAAALGDDPNFATTITNSIATKLALAGGTMSGAIAMGTNKITGMGDPTSNQDAATKVYVDTQRDTRLALAGGTMTGAIAMGTNKITGMGDPTNAQDAATKNYIDTLFGSTTSAAASAAAAATSASNAATSASNAATSASNASTSASNAASSASAAAASYDSFDDRYLGAKSSAPTLDNDGNALLTGALYFNSTSSQMYVYTGSAWTLAGSSVNGTSSRQTYTATASQTTFAITYDVGFVDVYLNGVRLVAGTEFTATSGTSIVLASGATAGDIVDIIAYGAFDIANTYTQAAADAKFLQLVGGTLSGNLTLGGVQYNAAGSAASPSISVTGDTNTGLFFPAADTIGVATGGTERMRILSGGKVLINATTDRDKWDNSTIGSNLLQVERSASGGNSSISVTNNPGTFADAFSLLYLGRSRGTANNDYTAVASGDGLGVVSFQGADGTEFVEAASIRGYVDGTPGANDMPGRLMFFTTPDGSATPTERMRIDSSGNVGIGVTPESMLSVVRAVRVGQGAMLEGRSNSTVLNLSANQYISAAGQRTYITTGEAAYYEQIVGQHRWFTAPSGTAGTTITFTQVLAVEKDKSLALQGATSQSGTGITFPATQSASTDANTLDDYEEGTWTPTFTASTPGTMSNSYIVQTGRYTKVGRLVTASFAIRSTLTIGTASGDFLVGGLPFTSGNPGSDMEGGPVTFTQNTLPFSVNSLLVALGSTSIIPIMTNGNSFSPSTLGSGTYTFRGIVTYTV